MSACKNFDRSQCLLHLNASNSSNGTQVNSSKGSLDDRRSQRGLLSFSVTAVSPISIKSNELADLLLSRMLGNNGFVVRCSMTPWKIKVLFMLNIMKANSIEE